MNVIGCGYRSWAFDIFYDASRITGVNLTVLSSKEQVRREVFEALAPQLVLFYGWSWIVSEEIIDSYTCLCLHPSRLPDYRGGSPIQHQILDGVQESAVSILRMTAELDAGPLCAQRPLSLAGNIAAIYARIAEAGKQATREILEQARAGTLEFRAQEPGGETARVYKRRKPAESEISAEEIRESTARRLHDKIRMLTEPYPNAFITCGDGERLYLTDSHL